MNSHSLSLMTYCSWAKQLIVIKNSNHQIKYLILLKFTANCKHLNHSIIFSFKHLYLNSITIKKQTQITILKLIKKNKKKKSKSDPSEPHWWGGQVACVNVDLRLTLSCQRSLCVFVCVCVCVCVWHKEREKES